MAKSTIDNVRFTDTRTQRIETGLDLGDHTALDNAATDEVTTACGIQVGVKRVRIVAVFEDAGGIAEKDQFLSFQMCGDGGGSGVGVDVEPTAIGIQRQAWYYGNDSGSTKIADKSAIHARDPSNPSEVDGSLLFGGGIGIIAM